MKNKLKFKSIPFEVKSETDSELILSGYGAIKGNIDSYNDVIKDGAFAKTLKEQGDRIAFAYQHNLREPIGKILSIAEDEKGLKIDVKISEAEKGIQTKIREGILKEMSIGYQTVKETKGMQDGKDVNFLDEIRLFEISLVTLAANPLATVESFKGDVEANSIAIEKEFDECINREKDNTKQFELMKLKEIVISTLPAEKKATKPKVTDVEIIQLLTLIKS